MAVVVYPKAKEAMLSPGINLATANVKAALIDTGTYTYSAAHDFLNDVTGVVGTSGNLASKTVTSGVFDAADITISGVTGATVEAVIVYIDSGVSSSSTLLSYHDGLTLTPNGGDVTIQWSASGIFALT
jgi:hypothetical protein